MVRERRGDALEAWMAEATHSGIEELARFARGLQDDLIAIKAGLSLGWSNGATEGQIHRLKLLKRQGYGRPVLHSYGSVSCRRLRAGRWFIFPSPRSDTLPVLSRAQGAA